MRIHWLLRRMSRVSALAASRSAAYFLLSLTTNLIALSIKRRPTNFSGDVLVVREGVMTMLRRGVRQRLPLLLRRSVLAMRTDVAGAEFVDEGDEDAAMMQGSF